MNTHSHRFERRSIIVRIVCVASASLGFASCAAAQPEEPQAQTPKPTTTITPDEVATQRTGELNSSTPILMGERMPAQADATTIAFLDTLEAARIDKLSANLRATRFFEFADTQTRKGNLYFESETQATGVPTRKFGAYFTNLYVNTFDKARIEDYRRAFVFDGRILIEIDEDVRPKLFKQREVIGPGEQLDPMALDQGLFPIPIGQKRDEILARYNARIAPVGEGLVITQADAPNWSTKEIAFFNALAEYHTQSTQLVLEPKNDPDNELRQIRLWYSQMETGDGQYTWLPTLVRTIDTAGDVSIIQLIQPTINEHAMIPDGALSIQPPPNPRGWNILPIERYRTPIEHTPAPDRE